MADVASPSAPEPSAAANGEYHVYRLPTTALGYDLFGVCEDGLDVDRTDTELIDSAEPDSGVAWAYIITAEDAGGNEGSMGLATCTERSNFNACP